MKLTLAALFLIALTGCAHKTIHEECSDPDTLARYYDYSQCYNERAAIRIEREKNRKTAGSAVGGALSQFGAGVAGSSSQQNCHMTTIGNYSHMTCN